MSGFNGCRRCDRAGDDLALHQQALDAGVDEAGAKLRQHYDADRKRNKTGDVKNDNPAGEAGRALRDKELPAAR